MKLDQYRQLRNDAMQSAKFFKRANEPVYMLAFLQQAKKYHALIMKCWKDEKDEHDYIVQSAREHGINLKKL